MPTINRVPKALLSILDGQTMGNNPKEIEPLIRGTLDLKPLYFAGRGWESAQIQTVINAGTIGVCGPVFVPEGEVWFMRSTGIAIVGAPAMLLSGGSFVPVWWPNPSVPLSQVPMGPAANLSISDTVNPRHGLYLDDPFVVSGGESVAWWSGTVYLSNITINHWYSWVRFKA